MRRSQENIAGHGCAIGRFGWATIPQNRSDFCHTRRAGEILAVPLLTPMASAYYYRLIITAYYYRLIITHANGAAWHRSALLVGCRLAA
jgi:hypothetical protein